MNITFFDILGIDPDLADRATPASALWPNTLASLTQGINLTDDSFPIVTKLQQGLVFSNVRPGVDPGTPLGGASGQMAFSAELAVVGAPATDMPFYLRALPDHGIQLMQTAPAYPAQVFFAADGHGYEVIIDRLPVRIFLKEGVASALSPSSVGIMVGSFDNTKIDSVAYTLNDDSHPCEIRCFARMHLTTEGDFILEPSVPISFGPVRFMGLPALNVYDLQILPSPNRRDYLEWARNDLGSLFSDPLAAGAIGFRSIDVDFSQPPFSDLRSRLQKGAVHIDNLELVLEDVVVPVSVPVLPIPSHGTFGFRRKITDRSDIAQAYSLSGAPVQIQLYSSGEQGGSGGWSLQLQVEKFLFQTGDQDAIDPGLHPSITLDAAIIYQTSTGPKGGGTISVDDQWTLALGMVLDIATTPLKFTIADTTIGLVGLRFGVSIGRLAKKMPFKDSFVLLGDVFVTSKATGSDSSVFKMRSLTGKQLSIAIHDLGYKLGHFSLEGLQMPDGMQLIFANTVRIIIEEMGWVEEANGTPYFSFSGGVALGFGGGNAVKPNASAGDSQGNGFGIRVRRLRFRLNSDSSQPVFKIDGVFLKLKYGTVDIEGFGYISDFTDSGWAVKEWGFGVKIVLSAVAMTFSLAAEFVKGSRRNLNDTSQEFDYFLAALELGFLPAGPIGLYDIRALVADNMAPNLDAEYPDGEGMALLGWHQKHDKALDMPASRTLADWIPEKDAFAFGVGAGFSLNGCGSAAHLDIFIFFSKSKADTGLLVVGDLYLLKNPKPIAFVAIEYDIDKEKFGVMVGVNLSLADFAGGHVPSWLAHVATLTGTLYFGNKPWSFAIGQLADQTTWLALKLEWNVWLQIKAMLGVCVQIVDGGPKGFGVVFTLSAGSDWGIGKFILWGSFGLIIGTWKTGSDSTGVEFWISLGFKINLFWIFSFGAEIGCRLTYLGKHPWYITLHAEIKIDTPWFLPDVTFTIDKTWQEPMPFDTATVTQCLKLGSAVDPTAQQGITLLAPGLAGALGDATYVYTFNQLVGLQGARIADTHLRDDVPIVSVDSTIAVDLSQPTSNDSNIATSTYDGTTDSGVQTVQDITVRYGLKSIAVRRAPRFGSTAGSWTDFVTDAQTGLSIGGTAPETLTFAWDADSRADGKLAPKRLLINSSSPYSFATQSAQNDEEAVRNDPDFPCCTARGERPNYPRFHVLEFSDIAFGARAPRTEAFSNGGALWSWMLATTPVVAPGSPAYPGGHVARLSPRTTMMIGAVDLPDPAAAASIELEWEARDGVLFFEAYDGVRLVGSKQVDLHNPGTTNLSIAAGSTSNAISRLCLRVEMGAKQAPQNGRVTVAADQKLHAAFAADAKMLAAVATPPNLVGGVGIYRVLYVTMADALRYVGGRQRCRGGAVVGPPGSDASGKLAFLPNHDYEVVVTCTVSVGTKAQGTRTLELSEASYFRTKGLPGLNACANVGDDIRRHVDATYPKQRATPLYRQEPCVVAFENSLSSILPIDRTPASGDPPEKAQMFPLELNVDRVVSLDGMKRLTVPSNDWIASHRANPYPPRYSVAKGTFARARTRLAHSNDPMVLRHEAVKAAIVVCGPPKVDHASQVLLHEPIDQNGGATLWEAQTGYRAIVRQEDGPFTERSGFDIYDMGAFVRQADGSASAAMWSVDTSASLVSPAGAGGRHYVSCGELDWDHLQAHTQIDLGSATAAGIAVGVGDGTPVPQAMLATVEKDGAGHALVVRVRDASGERELGRASVTVAGPFQLTVTAYDDVVRASVGEVSVDGPRGAVREGRVALVAEGVAAFAGIAVGAVDIYSFEFLTSRYTNFAEHLASWDGTLPTLASGALGGTPATVAAVLALHGAEIPAQMSSTADPQARQKLFDAIVTSLAVGLRKNLGAVTITRVTDSSGTAAFLIESPEPIALSRDVALSISKRVRVWVPGLFVLPRIPRHLPALHSGLSPVAEAALAALAPTAPGETADATSLLAAVTFGARTISVDAPNVVFAPGDRVARVVSGDHVEVYDAPVGGTSSHARVLTAAEAKRVPGLAALLAHGIGAVGLLHEGGLIGAQPGHWVDHDVPVPFVALGNGDETRILVFPSGGTALVPGKYTLDFKLERDRWTATTSSDPEQHYHDEASLVLQW